MAIFECLAAQHDGATLSELAGFAAAPKTSLVGLCNALLAEGCLRRDSAGRFHLGTRMFALAMRTLAGRELIELARPFLADPPRLPARPLCWAHSPRDADRVVYLDKVDSANSIRYAVTVGERRELHCTALGKVLLSHFAPERLERYLQAHPLVRFTPTTITDATRLRAELRRIRNDGIGRNRGERIQDAEGLAAAVSDSSGEVVAGVLIAGPAVRMAANRAHNEQRVRETAEALTRVLGGPEVVQASSRRSGRPGAKAGPAAR
ncbi:MAG: IclR family transcriptional regulator [Burkholderiaceae bacterium]|nr:IclR family transcriptional regulator [Burkholderiaceae bacterium]